MVQLIAATYHLPSYWLNMFRGRNFHGLVNFADLSTRLTVKSAEISPLENSVYFLHGERTHLKAESVQGVFQL